MLRGRSDAEAAPMRTRYAIPPEVRRLRVLAAPSALARQRLEVLVWHEQHGSRVRLTARHFGRSPDTVSRWARAFAARGPAGLEDRSRRPRRVRQPRTPSVVVVRIRELREQYPRWGREKLRVLLAREGIRISAKTIDRTLARLRARGELREPILPRKAARARQRALQRMRRPRELVVDRPGFLQLDTQEVRREPAALYTFAAVDHFTRKRVVGAAARLTSERGAAFLARVRQRFPFPVWAIQTDHGSEFLGAFIAAAAEAGITHYFNRPNYPKGQGRVERSFLTDDQEFHEVEELAATASGLERQLIAWNAVYEDIRPHQALGYLTPNEFYAQWLAEQASGKEELASDMS